MSSPPTPIALFNLHCKHVNFWHAHQLLYVHTLTHDLFGMPIILNCPWSTVHARISSAKLLLLAHCMIMLNIPYSRCKRLWKGFWSIILVSSSNSLLASIKSSRACVMKFPSSGSHLHLVIVSDKSSRGEVADLIARILTR